MAIFIHESSIIDENVIIGEGSKIWHFCHILSGSVIGKNCSLGQNCMVGKNVIIGDNLKAQNNISIYEGVRICDDVFLGPSVVFTNVINPRSFISRKDNFYPTLVKRGASIGANATIICGVEIGEYALIGARKRGNKKYARFFALCVGNPARQIAWVDKAGNKLKFNKDNLTYDSYDGTAYRLDGDTLLKG